MDIKTFWRLIAASKKASEGECGEQAEILQRRLKKLPAEEIIAFDRVFRELLTRAYRWDIWGAAYVVNGGCSADCFEYFLAWLIGQGETVYENALTDPDSLAGVDTLVPEETGCEDLLYVAADAYKAKTGEEMPVSHSLPDEPAGEQWTEEKLKALYPKLHAWYEAG